MFYPLGYNPSLDGLRAFAVMSVMLYHARVAGFAWGWIGVDLFFVISGFLITSILLLDIARSGSIDLTAFYKRRALRLFPALVVLCLAFLVLGAVTHVGLRTAAGEVAIVAVYAGNWTRAFDLNFPRVLGHTWSLAIEEQYYLLWPFALLLLVRLSRSDRQLLLLILGFAAVIACWRAFLWYQGATVNRLYNGTDTRADALLIGAALAFAVRADTARTAINLAARWLWLPALAVVVALPLGFSWDGGAMFCGGYTLIAAASGILVLATLADGPIARLLKVRAAIWIGRRSYGLYLWHYPILLGSLAFLPMELAGPISIVAAFVCSAVSYTLVECRFLDLRYSDQTSPKASVVEAGKARHN